MNLKNGLGVWICVMILGIAGVARGGVKKSLVIAIDGLRGDGIPGCKTPHLDRLMRVGGLGKGYHCASTFVAHTIKDAAPSSGSNHTSIMTGVTAKKHGVSNNGNVMKGNHKRWPHYMKRLEKENGEVRTAYLVNWKRDLQIPSGADFIYQNKDAQIVSRCVAILKGTYGGDQWKRGSDVDAVFLFLDDLDHAGHGDGFDPKVDRYAAALQKIDGQLGEVFDAIRSRKNFKQEDWQIVLTSDHGGRGTRHGIYSADNYTIPFWVISKSVKQGELMGGVRNCDAGVTAMAHMGLAIPKDLDGVARGDVVRKRGNKHLKDGCVLKMGFEKQRVLGKFGRCLRMGGKGEGYAVDRGVKVGADGFSIGLWFKADGKQRKDSVLLGNRGLEAKNKAGFVIVANRGGGNTVGAVLMDGKSGRVLLDWIKYDAGKWVFLCLTVRPGEKAVLYVGGEDGRLNFIASDLSGLGEIDWGLKLNGYLMRQYQGDLDELKVWSRGLGMAEVKTLYAGGKGIKE